MRPRSSDRGERGRPVVRPRLTLASMRPRSSDRGEHHRTGFTYTGSFSLQCGHGLRTVENSTKRGRAPFSTRASMRPRSSDRGELPARLEHGARHTCFNAATVFGPWRTTTAHRSSAVGEGFNAATVFGPWRTNNALTNLRWDTPLQCGHGLRTVENHRPAQVRSGSTRASMRPRSSDRGERLLSNTFASWEDRFNAATVFGPWRTRARRDKLPGTGQASMRPRSSDRGELPVPRPGWRCRWMALQCGHGLRTVENHDGGNAVARRGQLLQCGHGLRTVENTQPPAWDAVQRLAASMRPRSSDRGERARCHL